MPRFLVQGNHKQALELIQGKTRIGRDPRNDFQINDPSVSTFHCELHALGGTVTVRDLGSTNGTYVDSVRKSEMTINPGQILKLGNVELLYERVDSIPLAEFAQAPKPRIQVASMPAPEAASKMAQTFQADLTADPADPADCCNHPGVKAGFVCQRCEDRFCSRCIKTHRAGGLTLHVCPSCEGICLSLRDYEKVRARRSTTFYGSIRGAFYYPFHGNGTFMLLAATFLSSVLHAIRFFTGWIFFLNVLITGYFVVYLQHIIISSAQGENSPPDWPDFSNVWEDVIVPFLQFTATWLICLGPGWLALIYISPIVGIAVLLLGLLCIPMALLAVAMADSINGLNPFVILPSISKIPGNYLAACAVLVLVIALEAGLGAVANHIRVPILPTVIQNFLGMYGFMVEMRILGLLYYTNESKLDWFK